MLERCTWLAERRYLHAAAEAISVLRGLAAFVVQFVRRFVHLESERIAAISAGLEAFVQLQETVFAPSAVAGQTLTLLQSVKPPEEMTLFASFFDAGDQSAIRELAARDTLEDAIIAWDLVVPPASPLVLAVGKVLSDEAGVWRKLKAVVSADGLLHLFDKSKDPEMLGPVLSLHLAQNRVDLELRPQALSLHFRFRMSRIKSFLHKGNTILLKLSHPQKFAHWCSVLTQFLQSFTTLDSAPLH